MFVYEATYPIDYFKGMTKLKDYIALCVTNKGEDSDYLSYLDLQKFLTSSFMAVKCSATNWEGDINGDWIFISAIPIPYNNPYKLLSFKQYNNGSSFIVSEFQLPVSICNDLELSNLMELSKEEMMDFFEESFHLTMDLLHKPMEESTPVKNVAVISIDEVRQAIKEYDKQCDHSNDKKSVDDTKPNNKFDLKNYQKL